MTAHKVEQNGETWRRMRLGIPTASMFDHIVTDGGKPVKPERRRAYMYKLVAERIFKEPMLPRFESYWMSRGHQLEVEAEEEYRSGLPKALTMEKGGLWLSKDNRYGASPDRVIMERGTVIELLEIKVPAPFTQIGYILEGPGNQYKSQYQGQMLVCKVPVVNLFFWSPGLRTVNQIIERDEKYLRVLEPALENFCDELDAAEKLVRASGVVPDKFPVFEREYAP